MRDDVDQKEYYVYRSKYLNTNTRGIRADEYFESVSREEFSYRNLAVLAYIFEPELASRVEWIKMAKAILYAISFTLIYGKRDVWLPLFGSIQTLLRPDTEATPERPRRKWRWRWRMNSIHNKKNDDRYSYRNWKDAEFRLGIPQINWREIHRQEMEAFYNKYLGMSMYEYTHMSQADKKGIWDKVRPYIYIDRYKEREAKLEQEKDRIRKALEERAANLDSTYSRRKDDLRAQYRQALQKVCAPDGTVVYPDGSKAKFEDGILLQPGTGSEAPMESDERAHDDGRS